jgi:hypothetical protein
MAATPIVDLPAAPSHPSRLTPVVRVAPKDPAVDAAARYRACTAPFRPPGDGDGQAPPPTAAQLLAVFDPATLLSALDPAPRRAAELGITQLQHTLDPFLAPPVGSAVEIRVTLVSTDEDGVPAGAVVVERDSSAVTEQYAFPFVVVDRATGRWQVLAPPPRPAPHRGIRPMAGGLQFGQQVVGAAMAVTPFLPAPYGPAVTGVLSLINLILGVAGDQPGDGPTPLETAVQSIESFITETTLSGYAGQIKGPANEYVNMANAQTENVDSLTTIDGGIGVMQKKLDETWTPALVTANASLYQLLKMRNTTDFSSTLSLLVSGITTELLMYHGQVAIGAVDASIQYRHQNLEKYTTRTSAWTTVAHTAANDIGKPHAGDWSDADITDAMANSTAYFPQIEAWMAKAKRDRLAQVADVERYVFSSYGGGTTVPAGYTERGWTFTDSGAPGDGGYEAHQVKDTVASRPCDDDTQHKDTVIVNRASYVADLAKKIDDGFAPHRTIMASWTTYIADLLALLPPGIPPTPTATAAPDGEATPVGEWVSGADVRYSLMAKSTKGPSPAGEWSGPVTIGATAGAEVAGITPVSGAASIVVLRQFRANPHADWDTAEQVAVLTPPFPPSYRDTNVGGDPW